MDVSFITTFGILINYVQLKYILVALNVNVNLGPNKTMGDELIDKPSHFGARFLVDAIKEASGRRYG